MIFSYKKAFITIITFIPKEIMERKFIVICILLVTLSTINAIPHQLHKRALVFQKCGGDTPVGLDVIVTPDPPVPGYLSIFEVSGNLVDDIPVGAILAIAFLEENAKGPPNPLGVINKQVCSVLGCPYPAKTPFTLTTQVKAPAVLPDSYTITVAIINPDFEGGGCSFANVGKAPSVDPDSNILSSLIV